MLRREEFEAQEEKYLAPYALKSSQSLGRKYPEPAHAYRPAFQRDKERIIYTTAFRRLEYKTQVFINHEGDHYRTRLTHSLEVSLVSRSLARTLRLNEDLSEAVALAHDLGHSPFGHAGEVVLNQFMKPEGGFEHNKQSLRILEELEDCYPEHKGINLSIEILEGLKKHSQSRMNALEFQLVNLADDIAYNAHDLDDGLRSKYLSLEQVQDLQIWKRLEIPPLKDLAQADENYYRKLRAIRRLINYQVTDVIQHSAKTIQDLKIKKREDLEGKGFRLISFSPEVQSEVKELRLFLKEQLYYHDKVKAMTQKAQERLAFLLKAYEKEPDHMPQYFVKQVAAYGLKRVVCDYVAGMTDRFADREYDRLRGISCS